MKKSTVKEEASEKETAGREEGKIKRAVSNTARGNHCRWLQGKATCGSQKRNEKRFEI